jgi:hypothetical protein
VHKRLHKQQLKPKKQPRKMREERMRIDLNKQLHHRLKVRIIIVTTVTTVTTASLEKIAIKRKKRLNPLVTHQLKRRDPLKKKEVINQKERKSQNNHKL